MKDVNKSPLKVLGYAGKGVTYAKSLVTKEDLAIDPDRLEGEELQQELDRVRKQSDDFKRVSEEKKEEYSGKLITFKYTVKDKDGNIKKDTFAAKDLETVKSFLNSEGYEIIEIKPRGAGDIEINLGSGKISTGDLSFALIQLGTYIKAGIPLIDSMRILAKQTTNDNNKKIYQRVIYELSVGETFSNALEKQGKAFPMILINMVRTSEMTGDLAGTLDEMADYFTETEKTRKEMISALTYPAVILVLVVVVIIFLVMYVVPQFIDMFSGMGAELPAITLFVIAASEWLQANVVWLIVGVVAFLVAFIQTFKRVRPFRKFCQTFMMKMPIFGNVIINGQVSTITRTFASLLNHGVFITDSMEILSNLTNNEIYKEILSRTLIGLSKGAKLSETFKGEWAFPVVAYEMIVTGESTGQLALMMQKVAEHFSNLHHNSVSALKSLIEPVVILLLGVAVAFILLSVMLPMFDLYGQI